MIKVKSVLKFYSKAFKKFMENCYGENCDWLSFFLTACMKQQNHNKITQLLQAKWQNFVSKRISQGLIFWGKKHLDCDLIFIFKWWFQWISEQFSSTFWRTLVLSCQFVNNIKSADCDTLSMYTLLFPKHGNMGLFLLIFYWSQKHIFLCFSF